VTIPQELEPIRKRLSGLAARRAGFVLAVQGSAGMGKTFTVLEVLKGASCRTVSVRAVAPVSTLIQTLPRPKRLAVWVERELERPEPSPEAIMALLHGLAPLVIHVEDLHETSTAQLEFWQNLAQSITQARGVALIATSRTALPEPFETMIIEPLSSDASTQLLEQEVAATLPTEATAWIHARAAGNPLFTLEFFRSLTRRGFVWSDGSRWHWRTPDRDVLPVTVEAMIERTINEACTDESTRIALEARAYLEHREPNFKIEQEVWAKIAGLELDVIELAERNLTAHGVLNESGFAHPLFREVPIKNISNHLRQSFARRSLEVLPLEIGALFIEDAQLGAERSLGLLQQAAAQSKTPGRWLALAVEFSSGQDRARLALEAAQALQSSNLPKATALAELAAKSIGATTEAIYFWAALLAEQRQTEEAEQAYALLPESELNSTSGLTHRLINLNQAGLYAKVVQLWDAHPEMHLDPNPEALAMVVLSLSSSGDAIRAEQLCDVFLALPNLPPFRQAQLLAGRGVLRLRQGQSSEAEAFFTQALEIFERLGIERSIAATHFNRGYSLASRGQYEDGLKDLREAARVWAQIGNLHWAAYAFVRIGDTLTDVGRFEQAEEHLVEAHDTLSQGAVSESFCDALLALHTLHKKWRAPHSATLMYKYANMALEIANQLSIPRMRCQALDALAEAELVQRRPAIALALSDLAITENSGVGIPPMLAFAQVTRAHALLDLGDKPAGILALQEAMSAFQSIEKPRIVQALEIELLALEGAWVAARGGLKTARVEGNSWAVEYVGRHVPALAGSETISSPSSATRLEVLGIMQIAHESQIQSVRGQKRKELLVVLLEARILGRVEVTMLELFDALYPTVTESEAASGLKQTVFKVRSSYGQNTITTTANGYALGTITSDAESFLRDASTRLWRGAYLQDANLEPSVSVLEVLTLALHAKAKILLESDPKEAARVGRILLEIDPYDLNALRLVCQALQALENHRSLSRLYTDARNKLLEVGETLPEHWQEFLSAP
jgi:tetratricopeptide (TPR) repeat protein